MMCHHLLLHSLKKYFSVHNILGTILYYILGMQKLIKWKPSCLFGAYILTGDTDNTIVNTYAST